MNNVRVNFIISMVIFACVALVAIGAACGTVEIYSGLREFGAELEAERMQEGVIDDVTGWALLIEYIGVGVGWVLVFMMIVFSVILFIYAMLLFLLAWCARRCFSKGMRKIKQYRILMGIEYALQSIIEAILIVYVLIGEAHWGFWIPTIALLAAIVYSAVNTYTNRIMS